MQADHHIAELTDNLQGDSKILLKRRSTSNSPGVFWRLQNEGAKECEMSSTLRCKPGDLAIILNDLPGGETNIGRVVEIFGPLEQTEDIGPTWLIVPVSRAEYAVHKNHGIVRMVVGRGHLIEHPDAWMMPIHEETQRAIETGELAPQRIPEEVL